MEQRTLRIASRQSQLALVQTRYIQSLIGGEIVGITSEGDVELWQPLYTMPGVGVFVKQLEVEIVSRRADLAVHSLKDMPTQQPPELYLAAVPRFTTPRGDVAILKPGFTSLEDLPEGSIVGTSSLRRIAALRHQYRHKNFTYSDIRGNLNTRIAKLNKGDYDCIILAEAGLQRLGWDDLNIFRLPEDVFLHAPAQAALGIECRSDDEELIDYLKRIEDRETRLRVDAEREFMKDLEGGCKLPIGVFTEIIGDELRLIGQVWHPIENFTIREEIKGPLSQARELGRALSEIMKEKGGVDLLQSIRLAV
ncbi:HEMC [Blepharisma stoltei]|uniref:hydroxymethylbilane synthase n=1 Tax=Blepharisma stoltei TaxID=1481888 RepID=A0AAU9IBI6_9CILI|nr:unnamed protein product [Blepharisma stoltei]